MNDVVQDNDDPIPSDNASRKHWKSGIYVDMNTQNVNRFRLLK